MTRWVIYLILLTQIAYAGLPPTTSKVSSDSTNTVTFNYQFPNFTGTHTGPTLSLGVNGLSGGGSGSSTALGAPWLQKAGGTMTGGITMTATGISGMADPTSAQDAATKAYVDQVAANGVAKAASVYATAAVLAANIYSNGASGVGATLTGAGFGAITFDGSSPSVGNRVLVKNEVDQTHNGIYTVTAVGSGAALYVLTRATDFNSSTDIVDGATTFVTSGSTLQNTTWQLNVAGAVTVGSTSLPFVQIAGTGTIVAGTGLAFSGSTLNITATAVSQGSYTNASFSVDPQGRITNAANGSAVAPVIQSKSSNYTVLSTDDILWGTSTFTFTLPDCTGLASAHVWKFLNIGTGDVTIARGGSNSIYYLGVTANTLALSGVGSGVEIQCNKGSTVYGF